MAFWSASPCRDFGLGALESTRFLLAASRSKAGVCSSRARRSGVHREVELQGAFHGEPPIAEVPVVEEADVLVILQAPHRAG